MNKAFKTKPLTSTVVVKPVPAKKSKRFDCKDCEDNHARCYCLAA